MKLSYVVDGGIREPRSITIEWDNGMVRRYIPDWMFNERLAEAYQQGREDADHAARRATAG